MGTQLTLDQRVTLGRIRKCHKVAPSTAAEVKRIVPGSDDEVEEAMLAIADAIDRLRRIVERPQADLIVVCQELRDDLAVSGHVDAEAWLKELAES